MVKADPEQPDHEAESTEAPPSRAQRLKKAVVGEAKHFVVLFIYLWILFGLFVLNQRIILKQEGIGFTAQGFAVVNALILAKVMLVLEDINLGRWLYRRPLIYPILFEAFVFAVLFIAFHVLEEIIVGWFKSESISESIPAIGGGGFAGLLCVAVILFLALIPFFAFKHFDRALGPGQMKAMLFGSAGGAGES